MKKPEKSSQKKGVKYSLEANGLKWGIKKNKYMIISLYFRSKIS